MDHTIGEKMKQIRLARNMTQDEIGTAMGVSAQYISRWESGERNINATQLIEYAKIVGVTLDFFNEDNQERTLFQLMTQLESIFTSTEIDKEDKDKALQDIMKIYLKSKELDGNKVSIKKSEINDSKARE